MKIEKINLTKDNLLKIKEIDDLFYRDDSTTIEWYLERYTPNHIGYVLKDENDNFCGYIVSVPVKKELYDAITNGVLVNDININPKMYIESSNYNYIVSFVLLEEYRHQGLGTKIIESISNSMAKGKYCALTISKEGNNIAKKFMNLKMQINDDISVYEIEI